MADQLGRYGMIGCIDAPVVIIEENGEVYRSPQAANMLRGCSDEEVRALMTDDKALAERGFSATAAEYNGAMIYTLGGHYDSTVENGDVIAESLARNALQRETIMNISLICAYSEGTMDGVYYALSETAHMIDADCASLFVCTQGGGEWKSVCLYTADGDNAGYSIRNEIPAAEFAKIEKRLSEKSCYILTGLPEASIVSGEEASACAAVVENEEQSKAVLWLEKRGVNEKWAHSDTSFIYALVGLLKMALKRSRMESELKTALTEANAANAAKSQFVSRISHEMRTPLNAILGMTRLAKDSGEITEVHDHLRRVEAAGVHLLGIINDVLDLSRIEADKMKLLPHSFMLRELLGNVKDMISFAAAEKGLELTFSCGDDVPDCLYADTQRLSQVLLNLLSNAVKFTRAGSVRLTVARSGDTLVMTVSDTGSGIREEDMGRLFSAFERIDEDGANHAEGAGLGLRITKEIVGLMGGSVSVQSVYGKGSDFIVILPLVEGEKAQVRANRTESAFSSPGSRILAADDNAVNLAVTTGILRRFGIKADTAVNGRQAVEMAAAEKYDLILMDHMMPVLDGVAACEEIRSGGGINTGTPIIALTANTAAAAHESMRAAGIDDILIKPFTPNQLGAVLTKHLEHGTQERVSVDERQPSSRTRGIPGVNIEEAAELMGCGTEFYNEALRLTACSIQPSVETQTGFLEAGDMRALRVEAHGIKGALRTIGASDAAELALSVEHAAADGDADKARQALELFASAAAELCRGIENYLGQTAGE